MNRRAFIKRNGLWLTGAVALPAIIKASVLPSARMIATPNPAQTGAGTSYLVSEDCEGATTPAGWTDTGTVTWGSTTAPAPLIGPGSLRISSSSFNTYYTISAQTELWGFVAFRTDAIANNPYPLIFWNS